MGRNRPPRPPPAGAAAPGRGSREEEARVLRRVAGPARPFGRTAAAPRLGRPPRSRSLSGPELDRLPERRRLQASQLAQDLGVTPSYLSALACGAKAVSPERMEGIAASLGAAPEEKARLHRAAARDMGFRLDLPDDV